MRISECLGHQANPQHLRYFAKQFSKVSAIPWKSYLKVKHKYVRCVRLLDHNNEIFDALPVPRECPVRPLSTVTIVVIHTDRRQARNSRVLRSLPQPVQDIITSGGWDHTPSTENTPVAPVNASAIVNVEFQAERGGTPPTVEHLDIIGANLARKDNVSKHGILLYLPSTVTVPPKRRC